jgi:NRAMP (natural resistance-associated macrophage protein)-like metal ion transporter
LVTGASDDDPSGIATYSQVGAQYGYSMLWMMVFSYPLMAAIQEICARVGRVTGAGIAANLRRYYSPWILYLAALFVLVANVVTLGADIGAMAAAAQLLLPAASWIYLIIFGAGSLVLQIMVPYAKYARILKWLTLSVLAYIAAAFFIHIDWRQALLDSVVPHIAWNKSFLTGITAVLGTTISPYLFFWQASQEVEEVNANRADKPLKQAPSQAPQQLERIRADTYFGMALSNVVGYFIILMAAVTLHPHGVVEIKTAAEAAKALVPLAGRGAEALFACGIIGTGLLAVPVLAGSAGYVIGDAFKWRTSLEYRPQKAAKFYTTIAAVTMAGVVFNFYSFDPMRALYWAAVLNGVLAAPLMAVILHMASRRAVMGKFTVPKHLLIGGWAATLVMLGASVALVVTWKSM